MRIYGGTAQIYTDEVNRWPLPIRENNSETKIPQTANTSLTIEGPRKKFDIKSGIVRNIALILKSQHKEK